MVPMYRMMGARCARGNWLYRYFAHIFDLSKKMVQINNICIFKTLYDLTSLNICKFILILFVWKLNINCVGLMQN